LYNEIEHQRINIWKIDSVVAPFLCLSSIIKVTEETGILIKNSPGDSIPKLFLRPKKDCGTTAAREVFSIASQVSVILGPRSEYLPNPFARRLQ
jgi:hypothetical protein